MKKLLIIAAALVLIGAILCVASAAALHFDLTGLDTGTYETNTYAVTDAFRSISLELSVEKLVFRPSDDGRCKVVCFEEANRRHEVAVTGGTLTVSAPEARNTGRFLFHFKTPEITVYLPERAYADLRIVTHTGDIAIPADFSFDSIAVRGSTSDVSCLASAKGGIGIALSTGDITLSSVEAGALELEVSTGTIRAAAVRCGGDVSIRVETGKTKLQDVTCRSLVSEGSTGDITLDNVLAADTISVTRSTGDVEFNASDAGTVLVQTSTGDVTGSLRTEKVFLTETDTGKVDVPKSITGGRCEVRTETGKILLRTA